MAPGPQIDYNALATQAGAIATAPGPTPPPPTPTSGGVDYNALARQAGAIATAPATAGTPRPASPSLTANPNREGVYQMHGQSGAAGIPYSHVRSALDSGYTFANDQEHGRFVSDYRADPARNGNGGAHVLGLVNDDGSTSDKEYLANAAHGARQAADETFSTIEHGIRKIPIAGEWLGEHGGLDEQIARDDAAKNAPVGPGGGVGRFAENAGEFAVGDAELKYLGEGLTSLVKGANYADKLKVIAPILKQAAAHPALAKALGTAIRSGVVTGAQAGAHGATASEALTAGEEGAGFGGAADLGLGAVGRRVSGFAEKTAPATENIAGNDVQTLASQRPGISPRGDVTTGEVPKVARAQQAAAPRVFQSVAQNATRDALEEANQGRIVTPPVTDPARLLAPPEGSRPFTFTIPGVGTQETTAGEIAQPAAKREQAAFKPPSYVTSSAPKPTVPGVEGSTGADIATSTAREPAHDVVTGGGDLQVSDPETAQMHLSRLNSLVENPPSKMKAAQLNQITAARDNLQDQVDMYNAHQRTLPNFTPLNSEHAASLVGTFGEAEDQLQNAAKPIYQKLDEATDGQFNKLNLKRAAAGKRGDFETKFATEDQIDRLVESAPGITPAERQQANRLWSKSKVLGGLNDAIESASNVSQAYADQVAGGRVTSGAKLQNNLNKLIARYGQPRIESVIGQQGMQNMTRMADLLKSQPKSQLQHMTLSIFHNLAHGKVGATAGAIAGHFAGTALGHGLGGYEGAAGGALLGAKAERYVLQIAATNPRVGQLLDFAARNAVSEKIYAPLISAEILRSQRNDQEPPTNNDPGSAGYQDPNELPVGRTTGGITGMPSLKNAPAFIRNDVDMNNVHQIVSRPKYEGEDHAVASVRPEDDNNIHVFRPDLYGTGEANHELEHVFQDSRGVNGWAPTSGSGRDSYDYGGDKGLEKARDAGKTVADFNKEQQAEMVRVYKDRQDAFLEKVKSGAATTKDLKAMSEQQAIYHPFIEEMARMPSNKANIHPGVLQMLLGHDLPTLDARPSAPGLPSFDTAGMSEATADPLMSGESEPIRRRRK